MKTDSSVMVVYEDAPSRQKAVQFCDRLVERFWSSYGFDISWWSFATLQQADASGEPARRAVAADVIIFATSVEEEIPAPVRAWIEDWVRLRCEREGTLIGLMDPGPGSGGGCAGKFCYLRDVAHRAGMDYLTEIPQDVSLFTPDSLESCTERADRVTGVLDEILRHQPPPPHLLA